MKLRYGDISPIRADEQWTVSIIILFGTLVTGMVFGSMTSIVEGNETSEYDVILLAMDSSYRRYRNKLNQVNEFIKWVKWISLPITNMKVDILPLSFYKISRSLAERLRIYSDQHWELTNGREVAGIEPLIPFQ